MSISNGFSVLDMAQDAADMEGVSIADFFKNNPVSGNVKREMEEEATPKEEVEEEKVEDTAPPKKRQPWTPPPEVMKDLPESKRQLPVYTKDELKEEEHSPFLENIADDNAKQYSRNMMDEMERKHSAIEDAKVRHGIKHFRIPEGEWHVRIHNAAIDIDYVQSQKNLDEIFEDIIKNYPEFIYEWLPGRGPNVDQQITQNSTGFQNQVPEDIDSFEEAVPAGIDDEDPSSVVTGDAVDILIDKTNLPQVSWTDEEMEKIRKARTVNLKIMEGDDLIFSEIEDVDENAVDQVLSEYSRKANDVEASLPASRYRATFIGLSYPEVLDLDNSNEMNNLDGERAKWTIAFKHIRNQSIGPWQEWRYYIDPETKKEVRFPMYGPLPDKINPKDVKEHTKFDDFLMKTSWIDLEFILWKILCATAMDKEIITIECRKMVSGKRCGKTYDWVYTPNDLLKLDTVDPAVLEEMRITGEASGTGIMDHYNHGPVMGRNVAQLPHNGFQMVIGHVSAYEYLDHVYGDIKRIDELSESDPTIITKALHFTTLTVIKGFLLPKKDGTGWRRIKGSDNIVKILNDMDEVDWQTATEIVRMMVEPYQLKFYLRDLVCPSCHNKSTIAIESMQRLLFIVAQSLSTVSIELSRT